MKRTILLLFASAAIFTACKKDDETTTQQKIMQKWNFTSTVENDFYGGTSHPFSFSGIPGDYVDFRADGKVYSNVAGLGGADTSSYTILSDQYIKIDGDSIQIKSLTDNSLVLYSKELYGGGDYYETTTNLNR